MYHDASEVLTGDLPTPVKYFNSQIAQEYKAIEKIAQQKLIEMVPEELRDIFEPLINEHQYTEEEKSLVKQADALCAYLKCLEELSAGNNEFLLAKTRPEKRWNPAAAKRWITLCRCLYRASIYRWMRSAGFATLIYAQRRCACRACWLVGRVRRSRHPAGCSERKQDRYQYHAHHHHQHGERHAQLHEIAEPVVPRPQHQRVYR